MSDSYIKCAYCGKKSLKYNGHINRAKKLGVPVYCDRECAGLGRRSNKTIEQRKAEKSEYDKRYRQKNYWWRMWQGACQFAFDYQANPEKYRQWRKKRQAYQNEFCRQPYYRKWKKKYDVVYNAQKAYGDFGEAHLICMKIESIIDKKLSRFDRDCHNKQKKRKKLCQARNRQKN